VEAVVWFTLHAANKAFTVTLERSFQTYANGTRTSPTYMEVMATVNVPA
jgi:hypothetical protein